ncbi:hypothetical protein SEA_HIRKO_67 [Arthrobacter phage Hirko]|nr:hypothetical protein SEA_HIRKO_67 [Arthrobacter phage Hirko]
MTGQPVEIPLLEGQTTIEDVIEGGDDAVHEATVQH